MAFAVGVDFGSAKTTVAISQWDNDGDPNTGSVQVAAVVPSVVFLGEHHELAIGDHAHKLGSADPHRVIRDFKRRLGDSVPIIADGWSEPTESVVAALIRRVIDEVADQLSAAPDAVAVAFPAHWGTYKQALLAGALREAGLADVLLVSEPAAAVYSAEGTGEFGTVLVYDLGAGSFDGAIMSRGAGGEFEIVGVPQGLDWVGGDDFDQAIFTRVRHSAHLDRMDGADAELLIQMARLREACTAAKESLSLDTEVTIPVATPGSRTRIRMVRAEFEELIRDAIEDTLDGTRRVISSAGLDVADIDAVVLVGGSSRIPLVAQMISAEFSLPIVIDPRPEASISLGAAMLAAATVRAERAPLESGPVPAESAGDDIEPPPARYEEFEHGARHRHRQRRRFGVRTAGIVVAAGALIFAGSSLAASQAADSNVPPTSPSVAPPTTAPQITRAAHTTTAPQRTTADATATSATATAAPTVNAPAVVVDRSRLGGSDGSR